MTTLSHGVALSYGDEHRTTSNRRHALGIRGELPDGRVFRYARNSAVALEAGRIVQSRADPFAAELNMDVAVESTFPGGGSTLGSRLVPLITPATLDTILPSDFFTDGYMYINDGPGEGHIYHISSHSSLSSDFVSSVLIIALDYDGEIVSTNLSTQSLVGLVPNEYGAVVVTDTDVTLTHVLGVTPAAIAASEFFWLQTWGNAAVLLFDTGSGVAVVGKLLSVGLTSSSDNVGSFEPMTSIALTSGIDTSTPDRDTVVIGVAIEIAAVTSDFQLVSLMINP